MVGLDGSTHPTETRQGELLSISRLRTEDALGASSGIDHAQVGPSRARVFAPGGLGTEMEGMGTHPPQRSSWSHQSQGGARARQNRSVNQVPRRLAGQEAA